jgi:3',5'-cyclic AMP phosphodiesterase CpdA
LIRLGHLSDVHVQVDFLRRPNPHRLGWRRAVAQLELKGLRRARRFDQAEQVLARIAREVSDREVDHVVLTGDLTALALDEEFERAKAALGPLALDPSRLSVIPGNHDRYTVNSARQRRFERHFGHLLVSDLPRHAGPSGYPFVRLLGREVAVIGLESARVPPFPGLAFGKVGPDQLRRLEEILQAPELAGRMLCVLVHHAPLLANGRADAWSHGLRDAAALLRMLAGRPCTVHHGHVHHRYWLKATPEHPDLFNAGSSTMRGREGYWIVELDEGGVKQAFDCRL